ncbi:uncharacterized protein DFL_001750 [Arthrobotrys flagrans]|uniref:Anaphase-promoting complex subunit 4 WD40 domain-containing protein n=1 Tax=Arthrobotrys flagrans TaxID=97331 RepID=A0A437A993_ARTFL|nr:hypothetical protein DFL_001750 [Arthrobotrys flagrans]
MEEEVSPIFKSSFTQGSYPSPDGSLIASIQESRLVLQDSAGEIKRTTQLSSELSTTINFLKWSSPPPSPPVVEGDGEDFNVHAPITSHSRILVADDQVIEIFDAHNEDWKATLNPGPVRVRVTIWSLKANFHVDLQHPKVGAKGFGYRPGTNHFALLTRPVAHDMLNLYSPESYAPIKSIELPTIDAQALKWSPNGRWIAILESASAGYRVLLYTANGHMFRTHEQPCVGLGLRTLEWSSDGDFLVLGGYDGSVIFLNNFLFNKVVEMRHTIEIKTMATDVWSEELSVHGERHYTLITPPVSLPTVESPASDPAPKIGVSVISFCADGTLVATKDERMPNSVWIWSLESLTPLAILVQLSPVKAVRWHPSRGDLLAVVCGADPNSINTTNMPSVYLWSRDWDYPKTIQVSRALLASNLWLRWVDKKIIETDDTVKGVFDGTNIGEGRARVATEPIRFIVGDKERYNIMTLTEVQLVIEE